MALHLIPRPGPLHKNPGGIRMLIVKPIVGFEMQEKIDFFPLSHQQVM